MNNGAGRRINGGVEEDDDEDDVNGDLDAWERTYTDERSWESLQEDESGMFRPIEALTTRHFIIHSITGAFVPFHPLLLGYKRAASEMDFRPSRIAVIAKQISVVVLSLINALMKKLECSADSSLQNALDLVGGYLNHIPSYGHREVLLLYSALSACDPGDIMETIQKYRKSKIRCSVIGLAAEMFICKHLCQETGGTYSVSLDEETKPGLPSCARSANGTSAWTVTFTFTRFCTIALVVIASGIPKQPLQMKISNYFCCGNFHGFVALISKKPWLSPPLLDRNTPLPTTRFGLVMEVNMKELLNKEEMTIAYSQA
ncbi:protein arv1-like protein isoform X1 [Hibiscus syriacus]|uniref:Protein arv1-like protein isoform X1 n=1 Tax=Hibiscus syriacus TaxID=106335 RepID=A0A6A2ZPY7_HIBSY|nr:protein arv1-like protein isoform X1 [Hibiscus syriacus]